MERHLGRDFSRVQLHTNGEAARAAASVNARAFTYGDHIVFGAGEYAPHTAEGRRLLAHEFVHVAQDAEQPSDTLHRVPTRSGVEDGRYSYSYNCGWIDWSHADSSLATTLIARVQAASDALGAPDTTPSASAGDFRTPTMTSRVPHLGTILSSANISVRLLRSLSSSEVLEVALSLFKKLSVAFETQQQWTDLVGSSSFSQEDLSSNLLGFYQAAEGYSRDDIESFCNTVDTDAGLIEYDLDHDFERNRSFMPPDLVGAWPAELDTINDLQASALYSIRSIGAVQGTSSFSFCPMYRIEGTIGETDLFIIGVGGTRFTRSDNVRVVPTYRFREGTHGSYGHTTFVEVEPNGQSDFFEFSNNGLTWPIYVPVNILACLDNHGSTLP